MKIFTALIIVCVLNHHLIQSAPRKLIKRIKAEKSNGNIKLKASFKIAPSPQRQMIKRHEKMNFYTPTPIARPSPNIINSDPTTPIFWRLPRTSTTYYPLSSLRGIGMTRRSDDFAGYPQMHSIPDKMHGFGSSTIFIDNSLPVTANNLWPMAEYSIIPAAGNWLGTSKPNFLNSFTFNEPQRYFDHLFGSFGSNQFI